MNMVSAKSGQMMHFTAILTSVAQQLQKQEDIFDFVLGWQEKKEKQGKYQMRSM